MTAVWAAAPLVVLFVSLGWFRAKGQWAALGALAAALVLAVTIFATPVSLVLGAATRGAAFGLFPVVWILINALWIHRMTTVTGDFDVLRMSFAAVSEDRRVQGLVVAFSFGALLEALTGFGAPVAICSAMLLALGFEPVKAASIALLANTAPVPFGAIGTPVATLSGVTGLPADDLAATIGHQMPVLGLFLPLLLTVVIDGRRGLRELWPVALVLGAAFAIGQFAFSNFGPWPLTDIGASLTSLLAAVVFLRAPRPVADLRPGPSAAPMHPSSVSPASADRVVGAETLDLRPVSVARAFAPYVIIVAVFTLAQSGPVKAMLAVPTQRIAWPGMAALDAAVDPTGTSTFTLDWLAAGGTMLLLAGLVTIAVLRIPRAVSLGAYVETVRDLRPTIVTITIVLALAAVMTASGETLALGAFLATAGSAFAFLSPIIGWLGVAVTGSDTASNALFGSLQVRAAADAHLSPMLMAASNSSGGVLGKMCSVQHLAIAAGAVGMAGAESRVFRGLVRWSVGLVLVLGGLVWLQSAAGLSVTSR
jgi:lactate permease